MGQRSCEHDTPAARRTVRTAYPSTSPVSHPLNRGVVTTTRTEGLGRWWSVVQKGVGDVVLSWFGGGALGLYALVDGGAGCSATPGLVGLVWSWRRIRTPRL
jgi:hypothetical protein